MMPRSDQGERRWAVAAVILLQIILLVAAFSLGVYVERYGLTRDGLDTNSAGARAPSPTATRPLPAGLTEPPQMISRIVSVKAGQIDLITPDGPFPIFVDDETRYEQVNGTPLDISGLQPQMVVAVYGVYAADMASIDAERVVVLP